MTGEYLVLKGATAFALPVKKGQSISIKKGRGSDIKWKSFDSNGDVWFSGACSLFDLKFEKSSDPEIAERLSNILNQAVQLNSDFLSQWYGFKVNTNLEFSKDWGLGTSSSLVYCIAQWADVEPYELYERTFGGSGYDIACASADGPLLFTRTEEEIRITHLDFYPDFKDQLYFIYLGKKQSSAEAVAHFNNFEGKISSRLIDDMSQISKACSNASKLGEFTRCLNECEEIIHRELKLERLQQTNFKDFEGTIKSLGAWGGDFALVASDLPQDVIKAYFSNKGLHQLFSYEELACCPAQTMEFA
ncbi:MAG: GHMP kinase [Saprospirales bacterium]|nr:MAG: GHMP kinase [Saprospirales bacterium]